jgi:DnaJ-class molecular chaperone
MTDKCRTGAIIFRKRSSIMAEHKKEYEPATCCHCEGAGCIYCNKTGSVLVQAPKRKCPECEGAGCFYCGFTGWYRPKGKYD